MSANIRERLAALDALASASGKSRDEIFRALGASWGLTPGEQIRVAQHLATTPQPPSAAELAARQRAAETAQAQREQRAEAARIEHADQRQRLTELRNRNPFDAAAAGAADPSLYDSEPPTAA